MMRIEDCQTALVLAPHTDDGELGLGATIYRMRRAGCRVHYAAFSTAAQSVPEGFAPDILRTEVRYATARLGLSESDLSIFDHSVRRFGEQRQEILDEMIILRRDINPDVVFMPNFGDIHQDHRVVAEEGLRAFKNRTILGYELVWNNLTFNTDCLIEIQEIDLEAKILALKEYHSQGHRNYLSPEFIRSLAISRGVQASCRYAEAFEVVRLFL